MTDASRGPTRNRVLCLFLPHWPVQRARRDRVPGAGDPRGTDGGGPPVRLEAPAARRAGSRIATRPLVLHRAGRRGREVAACCRVARRAGVRVGAPLAEVHAHLPGAALAEYEPGVDRAALEDLAGVLSRRLSPRVGLADAGGGEPCGLAADVTGCAHLFGGERELAGAALRLVAAEGFAARSAVGDRVATAWALARFGPDAAAVSDDRGDDDRGDDDRGDDDRGDDDRLDRLPAAALRLSPKVLGTLRGLGVTTVGAVRRLPRASLPSRFGGDLVRRLEQFGGGRPEPVEPVRPPAPVVAVWEGEFPPVGRDAVGRVCDGLLADVLGRLPAGRGVRQALFTFAADGRGGGTSLPLATARPTREAARLRTLLALGLDRLRIAPPTRVTLTVQAHERLRVVRDTLFDSDGGAAELAALVETLSGRLGAGRVRRPEPTGDPLPERAFGLVPALDGDWAAVPTPDGWLAGTRPAVLLDPPEPVRVHSLVPDGPPFRLARRGRAAADVPAAWGPERVQTGWWRGPRVDRDYWRAELAGGELVWLFRDLRTGRWFLHGFFT